MATIDTLKVSRTLESAGFAKAQADVVAATFADVFTAAHEDLVTKDYLRAQLGELRSEMRGDIAVSKSDLRTELASLKSDLRTEIANSKTEMIRWMFASQAILIAALVALANFTKLL